RYRQGRFAIPRPAALRDWRRTPSSSAMSTASAMRARTGTFTFQCRGLGTGCTSSEEANPNLLELIETDHLIYILRFVLAGHDAVPTRAHRARVSTLTPPRTRRT